MPDNKELDIMYLWVKNTMQKDKAYPVKTPEGLECLILLYQDNSCPELGFKDNVTGKIVSVYKIDYDFLMK
jgi:hypothetical protein